MNTLYLILLLLAAILFAVAASGKVVTKYNLIALGLLCWVLVPLIQQFKIVG